MGVSKFSGSRGIRINGGFVNFQDSGGDDIFQGVLDPRGHYQVNIFLTGHVDLNYHSNKYKPD